MVSFNKFILSLASIVLFTTLTHGQNAYKSSDDAARIALVTFIPDKLAGMTEEAKDVLKTKLDQIASKNGLGGNGVANRFIITPSVAEISKDISATTPTIYTFNLEVTLYIADGIAGTLFSSHTISLKGTGKSDTKAYIAALKEIKSTDKSYSAFIEEGKRKIIEYYNSQCDFILKGAQAKADQRKFDEAISSLVEVPEVCKECFNKAMDLTVTIHKSKLELECQQNISKAKVEMSKQEWIAAAELLSLYTPDMSCYTDVTAVLKQINDNICAEKITKAKAEWAARNTEGALKYLSEVPPNSVCESDLAALLKEVKDGQCAESLGKAKGAWSNRNSADAARFLGEVPTDSNCAQEANALSREIASKLDADAKARWDFEMKKYQDDLSLTYKKLDAKERQSIRDSQLDAMRIKASRDVGVAAAMNQPKSVVYIVPY